MCLAPRLLSPHQARASTCLCGPKAVGRGHRTYWKEKERDLYAENGEDREEEERGKRGAKVIKTNMEEDSEINTWRCIFKRVLNQQMCIYFYIKQLLQKHVIML